MSKEVKIEILKNRINILENRGEKNVKSGGVLRKLRRQLRNIEF